MAQQMSTPWALVIAHLRLSQRGLLVRAGDVVSEVIVLGAEPVLLLGLIVTAYRAIRALRAVLIHELAAREEVKSYLHTASSILCEAAPTEDEGASS
ncbi:MAG: hypothetical protein A2666_00485 [Parcubacteria group bacterium RIFCSPHIGHO2_01_FULL_47_10b]|nr:MAG: hypothetical protein A2666_00485 [Parcubacteria group bacterium RIFCSPHIGHO2_01_FULL_47_10b]